MKNMFEVDKALDVIKEHPELLNKSVLQDVNIVRQCKNGYFKYIDSSQFDMTISLYPCDERYEEFLCDDGDESCEEVVEVDYKLFFGYDWVPIATVYNLDWEMGIDIYAETFEELVIKFAKEIVFRYGYWTCDTFGELVGVNAYDNASIESAWKDFENELDFDYTEDCPYEQISLN